MDWKPVRDEARREGMGRTKQGLKIPGGVIPYPKSKGRV